MRNSPVLVKCDGSLGSLESLGPLNHLESVPNFRRNRFLILNRG